MLQIETLHWGHCNRRGHKEMPEKSKDEMSQGGHHYGWHPKMRRFKGWGVAMGEVAK